MFFSECCFGSDRSHNGHVANVAVTQMTHMRHRTLHLGREPSFKSIFQVDTIRLGEFSRDARRCSLARCSK